MIQILLLIALSVSRPQAAPPVASIPTFATLEVDQVEILGVTAFESSVAETALELYPGDKLDRVKVLRTVRNLQELYRSRGYEKTRIESELQKRKDSVGKNEIVLVFNVIEGKPTRVAGIRISAIAGELVTETGFLKYWNKISTQLYSKVALKEGDLLDLEKVAASKRQIQETLASDEYIGAKVLDVGTPDVKAPEDSALEAVRWVNLEFKIDLGDRVNFGFRGNTVISRSQLTGLIDELRVSGLGRDYVNVIRNKIIEEYQQLGYASVEVNAYTFENPERHERRVSYDIIEGSRTKIESIEFAGNDFFTQPDLRQQFDERVSERVQFGFYVQKDIQAGAEALVDWIKSQGFLSGKLVTVQRIFSDKKDSVRVIVYLFEGDRTFVRKINLNGFAALSTDEVLAILNTRDEQHLNLAAFSQGLEALKARYKSQGFLDFRIINEDTGAMIKYSDQNRTADIVVEVDEGPRYRVSEVSVEGLTQTQPVIVQRELMIQPDDFVEESKLLESQDRLRKLGIFSNIEAKLIDDDARPGYKKVKVNVQEGSPGYVGGGVGFRNDLGPRIFAQTGYTNLWNRNHTVSLGATTNRRFVPFQPGRENFIEYQSQLGYLWPWWFSLKEVMFRPRITVEKTQFFSFSARTISGVLAWDKKLLSKINLVGILSYSLESTTQSEANSNLDNGTFRIGGITPSLRLDLRDNPLSPTRGFFATTSFEVAHPYLLSQSEDLATKRAPIGYTRFLVRADQFVPITRRISWYLSIRSGYAYNLEAPPPNDPDNKQYSIPLIKQFAMGGPSSLRGYTNQAINHYDDKVIRGSLSYVNYRTQIDFPVSGSLRAGPFVDAANLLVDRFSLGMLRYTSGLGLHYQTPIGPVNFDWGFKLNPDPNIKDRSTNQVIFSVGVI